jgi:hypothetical protein
MEPPNRGMACGQDHGHPADGPAFAATPPPTGEGCPCEGHEGGRGEIHGDVHGVWPWGSDASADERFAAAERLLLRAVAAAAGQQPGGDPQYTAYGDGGNFRPRPLRLRGEAGGLQWVPGQERVFMDCQQRRSKGSDRWKQKGGKHGTVCSQNHRVLRSYGALFTHGSGYSVAVHEYKLATSVTTPSSSSEGADGDATAEAEEARAGSPGAVVVARPVAPHGGGDGGGGKRRPLRVFHILPPKVPSNDADSPSPTAALSSSSSPSSTSSSSSSSSSHPPAKRARTRSSSRPRSAASSMVATGAVTPARPLPAHAPRAHPSSMMPGHSGCPEHRAQSAACVAPPRSWGADWPWGSDASADERFAAAERLLLRAVAAAAGQQPGGDPQYTAYGDGGNFRPRPLRLRGEAGGLQWVPGQERVFMDCQQRRSKGSDRWKQKGGKHGTVCSQNHRVLRSYGALFTHGSGYSVAVHEYKLATSVTTPSSSSEGADGGATAEAEEARAGSPGAVGVVVAQPATAAPYGGGGGGGGGKRRPLRVFHILPPKWESVSGEGHSDGGGDGRCPKLQGLQGLQGSSSLRGGGGVQALASSSSPALAPTPLATPYYMPYYVPPPPPPVRLPRSGVHIKHEVTGGGGGGGGGGVGQLQLLFSQYGAGSGLQHAAPRIVRAAPRGAITAQAITAAAMGLRPSLGCCGVCQGHFADGRAASHNKQLLLQWQRQRQQKQSQRWRQQQRRQPSLSVPICADAAVAATAAAERDEAGGVMGLVALAMVNVY